MTARRNVLVVDDDPHILEVLEMRLRAMGLGVTATTDPHEALRMLGEQRFDVALVDLRMEPMDGIDLMRGLHARQARLPVLLMTAHGTIENAVHAIKEGALDYLTKPFVPEELRGKIARALSERQWARNRELLGSVGYTLASSGANDRILEIVATAALDAVESERVVVFLRGGDGTVARASAGASPVPIEELVPVAETAMERAEPTRATRDDGSVALAAPLLVDGQARGALVVQHPIGVVPTSDDLDHLTLFAAQAAVALKNAQELDRCRSGALTALGQVATQVAHELNNPLGGLKLFVRLLEDRLSNAGDAKGVEITGKVGRVIDRLARLVKDITAYGRLPDLQREPAELNKVVDECLALAEERARTKGVRMIRDLDERVGAMLLDAQELQKVFLNLFLNGLDAMAAGGALTVRTRRASERMVEVTVEDTGCGMDADTQARMFDLFFTTKRDGTGLGMGIVRSVVDRHGGRLEVDSAPGRGTRVRVELSAELPAGGGGSAHAAGNDRSR